MTITAVVIADSISLWGERLTTMQLRYPRFIHAEFMTHRDFSRNASSSRAIPVTRLIEDIMRDTAMPIYWGMNQPGMQANEELGPIERSKARAIWLTGRNRAIEQAQKMHEVGAHKQIVNRILEPYSHINVIMSATRWANFYGLRRHPDAQPEIQALAERMWEAQQASTPVVLKDGEWHLPYVSPEEQTTMALITAIRVSVARCARVSYLTHDGKKPNAFEDLKLYERLVGGVPLHASPCEHQAYPRLESDESDDGGNFGPDWVQYRKQLANEYISV